MGAVLDKTSLQYEFYVLETTFLQKPLNEFPCDVVEESHSYSTQGNYQQPD